MRTKYGWFIGFAILALFVIVAFLAPPILPKEGFDGGKDAPSCPSSAWRDDFGKIHVEPGSKIFSTLKEYTDYLTSIYSEPANATCVPPAVVQKTGTTAETGRQPIDGLLGGLGTGAISPQGTMNEAKDRSVLMTDSISATDEQTYARTPINRLDDYEYSRVFELERAPRTAPINKETKNKLLSQYLLDWATLPFNSEDRAANEKEFIAGRVENGFREPKSGVFFSNMEGFDVQPPDEQALRDREKAILAAYRPTDVTKHVVTTEVEQVAELVNKMYANDPDWEPVVEKTGPNQYAITELRPKPRKERWAEDQDKTIAMAEADGTATINPTANIQIFDRYMQDPYFDKQGIRDSERDRFWSYEDFNKWTPGLERMFAPTAITKDWY
jgi:hypothetical protein